MATKEAREWQQGMQRRMPACPDTDKGPTKKVQQGVMMAGNLSLLNIYQL